ncbi:metallophosphoesterase family protein [Tropicimonas sediminicola]|uniref:Serine/threonine protein phosphatase 1 n=1 Tax=Tropicimonas sediminicola TaxID=1031541 RepID=A0A239JHK5_9RHOB|nr:metallophosphoesterase family protein [Tropicimonas sediminicola]SNT04204.1 serine/threonine protein phosphatase 1 [Tropicimonas sediminicola]
MSFLSHLLPAALMERLDHHPAADAPPEPENLTYAVGDVHGCDAKLERLLERIEEDRDGRTADIVFLGDYIDRGPDGAGVLRRVKALQEADSDRVFCLMGNHDLMMLDFLSAPASLAQRWLDYGGEETMASFGVPSFAEVDLRQRTAARARALREAAGPGLLGWLANLPLWWRSGNVVAVHGQTDPLRAMIAQKENVLLWGRPAAKIVPRRDGSWVVHGHTPVPEPRVAGRHVAIDTAAFRGGPLTAAVLGDGMPRFLSVT